MALLKNDIPPAKKYKGVSRVVHAKKYVYYHSKHRNKKTGERTCTRHETAREAAIAYDKARIRAGEEPVNILKRKSNTIR